jgi:hypothetical protein
MMKILEELTEDAWFVALTGKRSQSEFNFRSSPSVSSQFSDARYIQDLCTEYSHFMNLLLVFPRLFNFLRMDRSAA